MSSLGLVVFVADVFVFLPVKMVEAEKTVLVTIRLVVVEVVAAAEEIVQ